MRFWCTRRRNVCLPGMIPLPQRQFFFAFICICLPNIHTPCDSAATCTATVLHTLESRRLRKTAAVFGVWTTTTTTTTAAAAFCTPQLRSLSCVSVDSPVEMPRGGQYASYQVDGGFDEGVDHRTPRGVPCWVVEERDGEEDGEAKRACYYAPMSCRSYINNHFLLGEACCNLQRSSQESKDKANLFWCRHLQFEKNRPWEHHHHHIRDQTRNAIGLVKKHYVSTGSIVDINRLGPEVSEWPANRKREDNGNHSLKNDNHADAENDAAVTRDFEELVVQE